MSEADTGTADEQVTFSLSIEDGETVITMRGDRDTAVVVESESGERIYLPPEDFERGARQQNNSPYQSARQDSPYQPAREDSSYQSPRDDSPYQAARQSLPREGLVPTTDGYRIRHPEPATDVRLLR
ncbi:hypothetical protein C499_18942 [Halogeometricum borinquense DSM 11551]|uniref:Uncharacterized protein n=2 Tax=Halogeometricum borinquense TaxID=60847 RepID=E4NNC5_HALBP|nr:hypothetical protein [Halogeometricum borinquense]ADQ67463.1 hypothetical protein Hbor_18960 [Halogeometricum borinquense DSM 11551]ELY23262.1 hypothetical protein C499_18942 [Halogeometricum borinquense DSM 11551]RYJ13563.1 hypothetical protein ELS19_06040 [Halogeometricum borinquense]